MATWCLPPQFANAFIKALQSGEIDLVKLATMDSTPRRELLAKYVGKENAKEVNTQFEKKLLLKDWQRGMKAFVDSTAGLKPAARRDLVDKVAKMQKILTPEEGKAFLADVASKKLNVEVTSEQAQKITELAKAAAEARDKASNSRIGNRFGMSIQQAVSTAKLEAYVKSLKPTSGWQEVVHNLTSTSRNLLLMNPSTPIKTIIGQAESSAMEALARRIASGTNGVVDAKDLKSAKADLWTFFKEAHLDPSIMEDYESSGRLGEHNTFDVPETMLDASPVMRKLEAATRAANKATTKLAIDYEHVIAFTKFHQMAFVDSVNSAATMIAKGEGLKGDALKARATELFNDAMKIKPETRIGQSVRDNAQFQSSRVTSTNETPLANLAMGIKNWLNGEFTMVSTKNATIPFKLGLGDLLMPVAKIPANIIWNGLDNAGGGLPIVAYDMFHGKSKMASEDAGVRAEGLIQYANGVHRLARIVGTLGMAALLSSMFTPDDFKKDRFGKSQVRIAGWWVDTEYVSLLSPALAGMMTIKQEVKNYNDVSKIISEYVSGAGQGLKEVPGYSTLNEFSDSIASNNDKIAASARYIAGRMVPAPYHSLSQDRPVNRLLFGAHGLETEEDVRQDKRNDRQRATQRRIDKQEYKSE